MYTVNPRRRGEKGIERLFEGLRAENFPNLYIQESQQSPRRENTKRSTLRDFLKSLEPKDKKIKKYASGLSLQMGSELKYSFNALPVLSTTLP